MDSEKIWLEIAGTIAATNRVLRDASPPASRFGTYPVRSITRRTCSNVPEATISG